MYLIPSVRLQRISMSSQALQSTVGFFKKLFYVDTLWKKEMNNRISPIVNHTHLECSPGLELGSLEQKVRTLTNRPHHNHKIQEKKLSLKQKSIGTVIVAQLVEWLLPTPQVRGPIPVKCKKIIYSLSTVLKRRK